MTLPRTTTRSLAVAGVLAAVLTGCGAGYDAQTNQVYQAAVGVNERTDGVGLFNTLVVVNDDGSGTLASGILASGGEDDQLVGVRATTESGEELEVEFPDPVDLPNDQTVFIGTDGAAIISGEGLQPGLVVKVEFSFELAGTVSMMVPVVVRTETAPYDEVAES